MATESIAGLSAEALAFLASLGIILAENSEAEILAVLAAGEYTLSEIAARLVVASKCAALVKAAETAVATGVIPTEWQRATLPQALITTGLGKYDPRVAFQASIRSAYSAGRYERAMADDQSPYLLYRTMRDSRVRDKHAKLNGVALLKTDNWWDEHYPPNGWRCRCKAYAIDREGLDHLIERGLPIQEQAPKEARVVYRNKSTGQEESVPETVEPGWNFNPGKDGAAQLSTLLNNRIRQLASGK